MLFDRSYGIEIECYPPAFGAGVPTWSLARLAETLNAAGIPAVTSHSHRGRGAADWVVKPDGSLRSDGMEVASPSREPLAGEAGLETIRKVCAVLNANGFRVDTDCGLHVHVDGRRLTAAAFRKLAMTYVTNEAVFDAVMPRSRRGDANRFCRSVAGASMRSIMNADGPETLSAVLGGRVAHRRKYVKLNFAAFALHGTVEFRHHSGTLDAVKIVNWVKLCLRMVDNATKVDATTGDNATGRVRRVRRRVDPASGLGRLADMMRRPEGVTIEEARTAIGWTRSNVSPVSLAREMGMGVRVERDAATGHRRYWMTTATTTAISGMTLDELAAALELPDDEKTYWKARADWFARGNRGD